MTARTRLPLRSHLRRLWAASLLTLTALTLTALTLTALSAPASAQGPGGSFRIGYSGDSQRRAPYEVTFTATYPAGYAAQWAFGDGGSARGAQVTHTYYRPGTYALSAAFLDDRGREVGRAEAQIQVLSGGPERTELTVLLTPGSVRISAADSVLYTPATPRVFLDGREIGSGPVPVTPGLHTAVTQASSSGGQTVDRRVTFTVPAQPWQTSLPFDSEVLRLTNQARAQGWNCAALRAGGPALPPLKQHPTLDLAAQAQSAAMAVYGYFDHTSALDGSTPARRLKAAGMTPTSSAENIAAGQETPAEVVNGWLRSPGHCRSIMGNFTLIGLSYVNRPGSSYGRYWTQVFARP
ncbi:CAP domain-containing protein [Deinococcus sp. A31D244]|uniref:CAP domain-containing protein n=1 Tax=Deinococcus sp. A31D244 TaxID=3397675 RepID=UPI0039E0D07D